MSSKKRKRRPWSWQAEACRCVCVVRVGAIHRLDRSRVRVRVCEQNTEQPLAGQQATPSTTTPSSSLSPFRDSSCASGWTRTRCHSKPHPQLLSDLLNTASQAAPSPPIRCHPPPPSNRTPPPWRTTRRWRRSARVSGVFPSPVSVFRHAGDGKSKAQTLTYSRAHRHVRCRLQGSRPLLTRPAHRGPQEDSTRSRG